MVDAEVYRVSGEVLGAVSPTLGVTRAGLEVAAGATAAQSAQVYRVSAEVLGAQIAASAVTRVGLQLAAGGGAATTAQVYRVCAEVLGGPDLQAAVTRLGMQVGASSAATTAALVKRVSAEVLGDPPPETVMPKALATDVTLLSCHNWIEGATVRSEFLTHVEVSGETGVESRLGRRNKPQRRMDITWVFTLPEQVIDFDVSLREMTSGIFQMPIYPDVRLATALSPTSTTTLFLDTTNARFFIGGRVVIYPPGSSTFEIARITGKTASTLLLETPLVGPVPVNSAIMPLIDCETLLRGTPQYLSDCVVSFDLVVTEVAGLSTLPALVTGTPAGYVEFEDQPVFYAKPNWIDGIVKGRANPAGEAFEQGRASRVIPGPGRSRVVHDLEFTEPERGDSWSVLELFESRRGRLYPFWMVDLATHDHNVVAIDVGAGIISYEKIGDFTRWSEELTHIVLVKNDGTVLPFTASTIQDVLTVYRITVPETIPAGLAPSDIAYAAPLRNSRFTSDLLEERWDTTCVLHTELGTIELL